MIIKKLDGLVVKSFIGPFILTFFIAQFVLVMQFLWKYVDDLVGKGLDFWVLMQLLLYASARLVPLALPLAVLLASIMVYGSFGEHYELTAVKSAGISLLRFMLPLFVTVTLISAFAFYFSNNLLPMANLKFSALLYDIRNQKPTVALKPGIFYSGLDGFFIRAEEKNDETGELGGITVFDHTSGHGDDHVVTAEKGKMIQKDDEMALLLTLENGRQYREVDPKNPNEKQNDYTLVSTSFQSWEKRFDLSQFKLNRTDENFFKNLKQMLNLRQLWGEMDTIRQEQENSLRDFAAYNTPYLNFKRFESDSGISAASGITFTKATDLLKEYTPERRIQLMEIGLNKARNLKNYSDVATKQMEYKEKNMTSHLIEVYRKFTLSVACIVLFMIGAPLGSIIRRGGLGWPMFYCVLFFILYHVTSIIGEKMTENNVFTAFSGMWLSTFILTPIGLFLTLKAANDSKIYSTDYYGRFFRKLFSRSHAPLVATK